MLEGEHEYLAVADLAGLAGGLDRLDDTVNNRPVDSDFKFHFWNEADGIFGATIKLRVPFLAAMAFYFSDRDALDTKGTQRLADLVQLEGFYDCNDIFHGQVPFNIAGLQLKNRAKSARSLTYWFYLKNFKPEARLLKTVKIF